MKNISIILALVASLAITACGAKSGLSIPGAQTSMNTGGGDGNGGSAGEGGSVQGCVGDQAHYICRSCLDHLVCADGEYDGLCDSKADVYTKQQTETPTCFNCSYIWSALAVNTACQVFNCGGSYVRCNGGPEGICGIDVGNYFSDPNISDKWCSVGAP